MPEMYQKWHRKAANILKDNARIAGFEVRQLSELNGYEFTTDWEYAVAWRIYISRGNIEISMWTDIWCEELNKVISGWEKPRWSIRNKLDAYSIAIMIRESLKARAKRRVA